MESFQGRAPPTGWNDLPASLSPNLKFGGGSKKRINRNNFYQQYYSNNSLYSSYSSSSSQDFGSNQMVSPNYNPNGPPPMMGQGVPQPMMGSQNSLSQNPPPQQPPMMGSQNNLSQNPPPQQPPMMGMQQQQTSQVPSVNYFNPASAIPAPTFNSQSYNSTNTYQPNNYASQAATTPSYGNNNALNATTQPASNISNDRKTYIMNVYNKHLDTYNASCSLFQRKIYEDARQRINNLYEQLNAGMIDDQTFAMVEAIANALETKDANTASTNVSYLMRNSNEMKWVLGVKELVDFIISN